MTKIQKIFTLALCGLFCSACGIEEENPPLPYVTIDVPFVMGSAEYQIGLGIWPSSMLIKKGSAGYKVNGLILVRTGENTFRAYDATCTRNLETDASSLKLSPDKYSAECPKCKTTYSLLNGGYSSDGKYRLQEYRVTYDPTSKIGRITN